MKHDRRRGGDPEPHREDDDQRVAGLRPERPKAEDEVLPELFQSHAPPAFQRLNLEDS